LSQLLSTATGDILHQDPLNIPNPEYGPVFFVKCRHKAGGLRSQGFEGHILSPSVGCGFQNRTLRLRYGIVNTLVASERLLFYMILEHNNKKISFNSVVEENFS
jgi:hypothetical protein